jgi:primosomal protein N'
MEDTQIELAELSIRDVDTLREYYSNGYNATRAWMVTHPDASYESAKANASRWLTKANVKAEVERHLSEIRMSAEEAAARITDIARGDISELMDVSGMGFSLDMKKAKEKGLTKLIKKVKQKTTTHLAKSESDEDREVHEIEIELYNAHEAQRDILKLHGKLGQSQPRRENTPPGEISGSPEALMRLVALLEAERTAAVDRARAIDVTATDADE